MTVTRKKLIEVALPLEAINKASAREKSIRQGHPSTLHLWWARRPLAAARAVIFGQMVDDPSEYVDQIKGDAKQCRKAETLLKARHKLWVEAKKTFDKARPAGVTAPEPGPEPKLDDVLAEIERQRLFRIIEDLVQWENTTNEAVLQAAREEIWASWRRACADNVDHPRAKELFNRNKLPAFHDPFAGGGALPLEAQRLGLEAYASDLNPVAVLINKAMIEIPPRFAGKPPVNPETRGEKALIEREWKGAQGLAEDVRYYGKRLRDEAEKRIGKLYPPMDVTADMAKGRPDLKPYIGHRLTVIAWLWVRTVKSPNPAFRKVDVPLASTFMLAMKPGKEAYIEPLIEDGSYRFTVKVGKPKNAERAANGTKLSRGANFECLMSGTPISGEYIKTEGKAGRIGARLMAIVAEGERGRVYLAPTPDQEAAARMAKPEWKPDVEFFQQALGFRVGNYGMTRWSDLFSDRQTNALATMADVVREVRDECERDATAAGYLTDKTSFENDGCGATAYADAIAVLLSFALDKSAVYWNSLCPWLNQPKNEIVGNSFSRQTVQMVWDYAEANPFSDSGGNITKQLEYIAKYLEEQFARTEGHALQADAAAQELSAGRVVSTDPPYYDNIGYADLSDFFYVWLRRALKPMFPQLFATVVVPKAEELVATPHRHGGTEKAERFFLEGMGRAMNALVQQAHPGFPVTIYYAFKQVEGEGEAGAVSTGWETFLDAVIRAGFATTGTWPMRTERPGRMRDIESNALASSIVLVCRRRPKDSAIVTRRELVAALKAELPMAFRRLQEGNIAPVDMAQAAIGPGMAVYSRFARVVDAQGKTLPVREALAIINQVLDETLAEQEGDFDADSRFALAWFEQNGFAEGAFGVADVLARAKNTSVDGLDEAGILESKRSKVRLLKPDELPDDWDPATDTRLSHWEVVHHLIRVLEAKDGGEGPAAALVAKLGTKAETARELAYRLYTTCERNKRSTEALSYNALVQSWPEITRLAREGGATRSEQPGLFAEAEA